MSEARSFLASVKDEIGEVFAAAYDELSEVCSDDEQLTKSLTGLQKQNRQIVERRLKDSFKNGKGAANGKTETRAGSGKNPFRKS